MEFSVVKLMELSRDSDLTDTDLLDQALAAGEITADSVSRLYWTVAESFGRDTESRVAERFWKVCGSYLVRAGSTREQLAKLRRPFPVAGDPGFVGYLESQRKGNPEALASTSIDWEIAQQRVAAAN